MPKEEKNDMNIDEVKKDKETMDVDKETADKDIAEKGPAAQEREEKPSGKDAGKLASRTSSSGRSDKKTEDDMIERVVKISRVAKVVKGGKNFSFNALVIVGDGNGSVGVGFG